MKYVLTMFTVCVLAGCGRLNWQPQGDATVQGFHALTGQHCESSAMLNMLVHQGYNVKETDIIGAGATLGFVLESTEFPFLGGRSLTMKEEFFQALNITWHEGAGEEGNYGWEEIYGHMAEGTPVVLRVDMRYLPYLYGGKYGPSYMSFGYHLICLVGIEQGEPSGLFGFREPVALVTDTSLSGVQHILLKDLHKARFSKTKVLPPNGEYYWVEKAPADFSWDRETVTLASLKKVQSAMTGTYPQDEALAGLEGLKLFPQRLAHLDEQVPEYLLSQVLDFHYGCIETNGTGGSAFRKMYYTFLLEVGENEQVETAAQYLEPVVEAWIALANAMKTAAKDKSSLKKGPARTATLDALALQASELYRHEKTFYDFIGGME